VPPSFGLGGYRSCVARAHNLGTLEVPDAKTAEAEAVRLFALTGEQRERLAVREQ